MIITPPDVVRKVCLCEKEAEDYFNTYQHNKGFVELVPASLFSA